MVNVRMLTHVTRVNLEDMKADSHEKTVLSDPLG